MRELDASQLAVFARLYTFLFKKSLYQMQILIEVISTWKHYEWLLLLWRVEKKNKFKDLTNLIENEILAWFLQDFINFSIKRVVCWIILLEVIW